MKQNTVVLFDKYDEAKLALDRIFENDPSRDQVSIVTADPSQPSCGREGAVHVGGLAAAGLGLTALVIPGIGPVLAAGALLSTLRGPGGGLYGGVLDVALERFGLTMEEARRYTESVRTGGAIVAVTGDREIASQFRDAQAAAVVERPALEDRALPRDQGEIEKTAFGPAQMAPENPEYDSSFDEFAGVFARDQSVLLGDRQGPPYAKDRDAFSFGYQMGLSKRLAGREWVDVERDVEAEWRKQNRDDWDRFHSEVQKGWSAARGGM